MAAITNSMTAGFLQKEVTLHYENCQRTVEQIRSSKWWAGNEIVMLTRNTPAAEICWLVKMATTLNHGRRWKTETRIGEPLCSGNTIVEHRNRKIDSVFVFFKRPEDIQTQQERELEEIIEDFVSGTRLVQGFPLVRLINYYSNIIQLMYSIYIQLKLRRPHQ